MYTIRLGLFLVIFRSSQASLYFDKETCLLWLKSDGSSCQLNKIDSFQSAISRRLPTISILKHCCKELDKTCFNNDKNSPWECHIQLPDCMDKIKPMFYFYTPGGNVEEPQLVDFFNLDSSVEALNTGSDTEIREFATIIHGYGGDWPKLWMHPIRDNLLALNYNVMMVRWTGGSKPPLYFQSASNTRTVGAAVAKVISALKNANKVDLSKSTIFGFSLGAQTAGYAGAKLPGLRRIIAMDPAGPMFTCMRPDARLDPTDAEFVQVIHTHGDYFLAGGCGSLQQFGHVDFYANGGVIQPGCTRPLPQALEDFLHLNFTQMVDDIAGPSCSHNRAPAYLAEMIKNFADPDNACQYQAFPCPDKDAWLRGECFKCPPEGCPKVGLATDKGTPHRGVFHFNNLADNSSGQFCGSQYLISLKPDRDVKGEIVVTLRQDDKSIEQRFQEYNDVMEQAIAKKFVVVAPWSMKEVQKLDVFYNKHTFGHISDGVDDWTLTEATITDKDGAIKNCAANILVNSGIPVMLNCF